MEAVEYTKYGIASRVGDKVYLNKDLLDYPILCKALLKHEQAHTSKFAVRDIVLDLKGTHISPVKKQYYKFLFTHPKSWTQFIPVWIYNKKIVVDPIMTFVWFLMLIMIKLAVWSWK